jgi:hypothetical protein
MHYPVLRLKGVIKKIDRKFNLTLSGYGWIGYGSIDIKNDGFPGYTQNGWMLCTDGKRVYHNNTSSAVNAEPFAGKTI